MQWGLISLSALVTLASAQTLTIDNNISLNPAKNGTTKENVDNYNSSLYSTSISTSSTVTSLSDNSGNDDNVLPDLSDARFVSSQTSESSESTSNETSKSEENFSNQIPNSTDSTSEDAPSEETIGPVNNTSEVSNEKPSAETTTQTYSIKPDSNENPGGEVLSEEKPEGGDMPIFVSRSASGADSEPISDEVGTLVQTAHGTVRGQLWHNNTDVVGFIDIPYGKFNGSFEAPFKVDWSDVHEITEHSKLCPQYDNDEYLGDTDCLTLSIFTPKEADNASVLFHIHNSYFGSKSADPLIYGPDYLVPKGVILVLPNYRLGPMGFLCMQNETAPGNAGLKDLALALTWVKENIHVFGGNAANIVVSGDGAAAAYAGYLALCSRTKYYINKVITESGSPLSHWALDRNPIAKAYELAKRIRSERPDDELNNTFEEAALSTIIKAAQDMRFNPCIEHDNEPFMEVTPWRMLHDKEIDTTFMIGSASYAGAHEAAAISVDLIEALNTNFGQFLPNDLIFENDAERNTFAAKLKIQYFNETITANHAKELSLWYTDASYLSPGIRLARPLLEAGATVYLYEFAFVGSLNRELEALNNFVPGAVRGDIVGYLFRKDGVTVEEGSSEKHMINLMVDLWVSFINSGKPAAKNVVWNEFKQAEEAEEEWLLIDSEPKPMKGIHVDRLRLWTNLYEEHFIEHNSALRLAARYCLTLAAALAWRMATY